MTSITVFISSAGRRRYLIEWFRTASSLVECDVIVVAGDADPHAPALGAADEQVILPPITSANYSTALLSVCSSRHVDLFLSLHDYEILVVGERYLDALESIGTVAALPPKDTLTVVADKLRTAGALAASGLHVPTTRLASDRNYFGSGQKYVVKHRYGSGSSGVFIVDGVHLRQAIFMSALCAPEPDGRRLVRVDESLVVVQDHIEGEEYGIDVVCDLDGSFRGVLARKKLRMRAGETDQAVTVESQPFEALAKTLASELALRGTTDVDVLVTAEGDQYIIDINPRFGGGYPFVHMAGANVPACYLAWATGAEIDQSWLEVEPGVVSNKYEAIHRSEV